MICEVSTFGAAVDTALRTLEHTRSRMELVRGLTFLLTLSILFIDGDVANVPLFKEYARLSFATFGGGIAEVRRIFVHQIMHE